MRIFAGWSVTGNSCVRNRATAEADEGDRRSCQQYITEHTQLPAHCNNIPFAETTACFSASCASKWSSFKMTAPWMGKIFTLVGYLSTSNTAQLTSPSISVYVFAHLREEGKAESECTTTRHCCDAWVIRPKEWNEKKWNASDGCVTIQLLH